MENSLCVSAFLFSQSKWCVYIFADEEMRWQKKLKDRPLLNACTQRLRFWGRMAFFNAVLVNIILALCYPFDQAAHIESINLTNPFVYLSLIAALAHLYVSCEDCETFGQSALTQRGVFALIISVTLFIIALAGTVPTLYFIGGVQLANKLLHTISYVGNKGLIDRSWSERFADGVVWYHLGHLLCCILGLFVHPFFYSILVCFFFHRFSLCL